MILVSTLLLLIAIPLITWLHSRLRLDFRLSPQDALPPPPYPRISVIVPARNEERNIRDCVEHILAQTYPNLELLVVEDRSTDATPQILAELQTKISAAWPGPGATAPAPGASSALEASSRPALRNFRVIQGGELPPGWAGKPYALHQGVQHATGAWFCFVDADTRLHPSAIAAAFAMAIRQNADLLTLFTRQRMESFWEWVIQPLVFTALSVGFSPPRVNDPHTPDAIANGQFILIRRSVYEAVGGHAAIRHSIVEDKDLAERVKRAGYRLLLVDGEAVAETRMYTSLAEIWEGWTKNMYLGLKDSPWLLGLGILGALLGLAAGILLPLWLAGGFLWAWQHPQGWNFLVPLEALIAWLYLLFWRVRVALHLGIPLWSTLFTPLGALLFSAMMFTSAWNVLSGRGVRWKGRTYLSGA
jgi:chlorobactene glucosyltransferase